VVIGGIGTIEGPIIGTIVYMVLQQELASYNAWYFIVLGLVAIVVVIGLRRGLWGELDDRLHVRLFPVGYWLWTPESARKRGRLPGLLPGSRGQGGNGSLLVLTTP
jgi:branched-chain amino acid transport system permease protein